jgi:hypothetical protein
VNQSSVKLKTKVPTSAFIEDRADLAGREFPPAFLRCIRGRCRCRIRRAAAAIAGDVLQSREIIAENLLIVEIDVEADEIDLARPQIFGGREIGEGEEAIGRFGSCRCDQVIDEIFDRSSRREADDVRRDFVDDADGENRRVIAALRAALRTAAWACSVTFGIADERQVLGPGSRRERFQPISWARSKNHVGGMW